MLQPAGLHSKCTVEGWVHISSNLSTSHMEYPPEGVAGVSSCGRLHGVCEPPWRWLLLLKGHPCTAPAVQIQLTIPTSAPDLPSHGEAPQVDDIALHTFPTKHVA